MRIEKMQNFISDENPYKKIGDNSYTFGGFRRLLDTKIKELNQASLMSQKDRAAVVEIIKNMGANFHKVVKGKDDDGIIKQKNIIADLIQNIKNQFLIADEEVTIYHSETITPSYATKPEVLQNAENTIAVIGKPTEEQIKIQAASISYLASYYKKMYIDNLLVPMYENYVNETDPHEKGRLFDEFISTKTKIEEDVKVEIDGDLTKISGSDFEEIKKAKQILANVKDEIAMFGREKWDDEQEAA